MIVEINTDTPAAQPPVRFDTDQEYIQFVMSSAARSYQAQYGTATADEGITAAREAYNASVPVAPATPEPTLPPEPTPAPTPAPVDTTPAVDATVTPAPDAPTT